MLEAYYATFRSTIRQGVVEASFFELRFSKLY